MNRIFVLLGSNIEPEINIPLAINYLNLEPDLTLVRVSSTWRTKPVGSCCTDFLNTAVLFLSSIDPQVVKIQILAGIETRMGRVRTEDKNAPRTIDLDILAINDTVLDLDVFEFDHLVFPLSEIAPDLLDLSNQSSLADIAHGKENTTQAVRVDHPATSYG